MSEDYAFDSDLLKERKERDANQARWSLAFVPFVPFIDISIFFSRKRPPSPVLWYTVRVPTGDP